jgi:hypothetical protein
MQFLGVKQASKQQRGKLIFDPVRNCLRDKITGQTGGQT